MAYYDCEGIVIEIRDGTLHLSISAELHPTTEAALRKLAQARRTTPEDEAQLLIGENVIGHLRECASDLKEAYAFEECFGFTEHGLAAQAIDRITDCHFECEPDITNDEFFEAVSEYCRNSGAENQEACAAFLKGCDCALAWDLDGAVANIGLAHRLWEADEET